MRAHAYTLTIMGLSGWVRTAADVVRDAVAPPRITLDLPALHQFYGPQPADLAPQPVDRLLTAMRLGTGPISRDRALQVAAVQRGRNELCSIATLPIRLYKGDQVVESALFRQFDLDVPNVVHMAMTVEDLAFERIAWWEVVGQDAAGYPMAVRRHDPKRVRLKNPTGTPQPDDHKWVWIEDEDHEGKWRRVPAVLMKRFDSPNPGILKANARAIRIAEQLDNLTEMYADNPALREYFTDGDDLDVEPYTDTEIDGFLAEYGSMRQARPFGWLPKQVKRADVTSPSPKDLTLVDLRQEVMVAIANGLGVDPEDIGVSTTSRTYQNEDARRRDKINRMYAPYMKAITDRLSMGDITMRGYDVRFDLSDYLKPDPAGLIAYWEGLQRMGVVDKKWIAGQAGIDPSVVPDDPAPAPVAPRSSGSVAAAGRPVRTFDAQRPAFVFSAAEFAADVPAPTADEGARTITGLAVPYNKIANKFGLKYRFKPGSLEYSTPDRMAHLMDHGTPVGFHTAIADSAEGPMVTLSVLDAPEGSPAKMQRDQLLYDAAHGLYSGLSVGVDFSTYPEDGDVEFNEDDQVYDVVRATWRETSSTYMPAFDDARVTKVAASLTGGNMDPCQHCGHRHAANVSCRTFAAQMNTQTQAPAQQAPAQPATQAQTLPAPAQAPAQAYAAPTFEQFQAWIAQQQNVAPRTLEQGPSVVSPHRGAAQVREPSPYRFDRKGNLRAGSHDFSTDLFLGWTKGDQAARDRAEAFVRQAFEENEVGSVAPLSAAQQFAVTPTNVVNLNYPQNRPDLYVDQMEFQYPLWNAVDKGTLDAVTPFVIPKFSSATGLVADHVTGTEPTPGTFVATAQTITPTAVSGKVEITREAFDQGGNPQMSGLIWRQMVRGYYEALEAYVQAQLVANAASITDLTITALAVDSALDQAITDVLVPLQFIRGGDRFSRVFTQVDLYKAMVKAKDGNGRRLYPSLGAQNAVGSADPGYAFIEAHGKLWVPAWATAASGTVAASSWMFDPEKVCAWASAPRQINLEWRAAWVDMALFGYKAFGITDFAGTRELVYDPI